jgi:hypothetical protein
MPILLSLRLRKTLAWLALCAMCFGAAAPTVSKWLAATAQAANLVEICDGHGVTLVTVPDIPAQAQTPDARQSQHHSGNSGHNPSGDGGDCCLYCTLMHHWPSVPVVAVVLTLYAPLLAARHVDAAVPVPVLRAWRKPYMPQAPPVVV